MFSSYLAMLRSVFKDYRTWFNKITDPRYQPFINYPLRSLLWSAIVAHLFKINSRRGLTYSVSQYPVALNNFIKLTGGHSLERFPHHDTINNTLVRLNPLEIEQVNINIVNNLIRKKSLDEFRFFDTFLVAFDATRLFTYSYQHCPWCLKTEYKDGRSTIYHHDVLAARLVFPSGLTMHIASEFIENEGNYNKQDCEQNAAKRLMKRVKQYFPQLKITALFDGLYLSQQVMAACREYKWHFMITFKEGSAKAVYADYLDLKNIKFVEHADFTIIQGSNNDKIIKQKIFLHNKIDFQKTTVNVLEGIETIGEKITRFMYVTDIALSRDNIFEIFNQGGRQRWKIENQGFNELKNGGYGLTHQFSQELVGIKVYYYLMQIAQMLNQLFEHGIVTKKKITKIFSGIKYAADALLNAFRLEIIDLETLPKINFNFSSA